MKRRRKWIAKLGVEFGEHGLRIEADSLRIRPKVAVSVHAMTRPATQIVIFEIDQQLVFNFGELRNLANGEMLAAGAANKLVRRGRIARCTRRGSSS